ncbi:hypothetical protein F5Y14DRAFT_416801 [Nemania sp. NC0429]|nr:hypothetical protein F5Y14DRAFT_416801 [Nemania sp. NC0429]
MIIYILLIQAFMASCRCRSWYLAAASPLYWPAFWRSLSFRYQVAAAIQVVLSTPRSTDNLRGKHSKEISNLIVPKRTISHVWNLYS